MSEEINVKEKKHFFKKKERNEVAVGATPKKKKKKVWIAVLVAVILVIAVIGNAFSKMTSQIDMSVYAVEVAPVEYRDLSDYISIKGTVSGTSKTNVVSKASAEVTAVNVQVGDVVSAGDVLVALDTEDIEKQIADTKTDITNANAIAQNDANLVTQSLTQAQEDQASALAKATTEINQAKTNYDNLLNQYYSIEAGIISRKAQLEDANTAVANAERPKNDAATVMNDAKIAWDADTANAGLKTEYETAKAEYDAAAKVYSDAVTTQQTLSAEITSLEEQLKACVDAMGTAKTAIDAANTSYNDTVTATNRTVASAQNAVDMSKYQSDDSGLDDKLDNLEEQLLDCNMTAPCSGVVTAVNVSVGDNYTAGMTMITIEDTSAMKVIVTVEEADILKLEEGMNAIITTDATGDEEISGTVTRVVRVKNQSTNATDVNTASGYSAEISIDNTELLVGMSAKARIIIQEKENVLAVPYDLIQYDENGDTFVLVAEYNEDGTATAIRKDITVGEEVDYYVEVLGGDLTEGDLLIYDYTYSMVEGQTFTPAQSDLGADMSTYSETGVEAE